jgi:FlaG/FlaF family flagellin (archaellin)
MKRIRVFGRDSAAASPVIGEVLMVAIVIVLAAVAYIMVSGMLTIQDEDKVTMTMTFPDVEGKSRGATPTRVWDVSMDITKVIPDSYKLVWNDVSISIKGADGSLLQPKSKMDPDNPAMYDNNDVDGIDVEFWYVEGSATDTIVSGGDSVKVTGMDVYYEGATIQFTKAGELIAQVKLPTNFQ